MGTHFEMQEKSIYFTVLITKTSISAQHFSPKHSWKVPAKTVNI
jgi:hypothetical protein